MTSRSVRSSGALPALGVGLGLALALATPRAAFAKDGDPIDLTWEAPAGCLGADAVLARVRQIAGELRPGAVPLQAHATVTEDANHQYELTLVLRSGNLEGTRHIKGRSCRDLAGAVAVALALLLSPEQPLAQSDLGEPAADRASASETPAPGSDEPSSTPDTTAPPPDEENESPGSPRSFRLLLAVPLVALSIGPQHEPLWGPALGAGVGWERYRVYAEGKRWTSRNATATREPENGARLQQYTLSLRACRSLGGERFELSPCALVSLQHLSAEGTGSHIAPQAPSATWAAAGVGLRARYLAASWLGFVAGVDGEAQFSRPAVELGGVGSVERLSWLGATFAVGAEWIL